MNNFDSIDDTKAFEEKQSFIITKEYKRFAEFCDACLREEYIGLCYGSPGVGKTLSARYYTKWFFLEKRLQHHLPYAPLLPEIRDCSALLYTASVSSPPRLVRENIRSMRVELGRLIEEFSVPGQQDTPIYAVKDRCKLIIVDETERLSLKTIEQFREIY
ncbi:MAG: AAA family ATPase, partial [Cyanobacteria bacterium P01_E01_bin.35]